MNLTRCENGHFYDSESFDTCPHCSNVDYDEFTKTKPSGSNTELGSKLTVQETESKSKLAKEVEMVKSVSVSNGEQKTVGYYDIQMGTEPVVGWLVCIEGSYFGEDFRLKSGRNFIGRSNDMDVALCGDESVSRKKHAIILYEPKQNIFIVQPGDSKELFYLNEEVVLGAVEIKEYDVLALGETKLLFVPCCNGQFKWDDVKKKDKEDKEEK